MNFNTNAKSMKEGKCLRLEDIKSPQDIKGLSYAEMNDLAAQIRTELVTTISFATAASVRR